MRLHNLTRDDLTILKSEQEDCTCEIGPRHSYDTDHVSEYDRYEDDTDYRMVGMVDGVFHAELVSYENWDPSYTEPSYPPVSYR